MAEKGELGRLEIKKYANRRFYDLAHSRHIKLDEIHAFIKEGHDVHIIDAKDGSDITTHVLLQIILEFESSKLDLIPVPLLVWLIRVDSQSMREFARQNLSQAFKPFLEYQRQFQEQLRAAQGSTTGSSGIAEWAKAVAAPFKAAFSAQTGEHAKPEPEKSAAEKGQNEDLQELIRELKGNKA